MSRGHVIADQDDVRGVEGGVGGDGVVFGVQGEVEGGAVAEGFFLGEGAVLPAAAGVFFGGEV